MNYSNGLPTCLGSVFPDVEKRLFVGLPVLILSSISVFLNITLLRIISLQKSFLEAHFRKLVFSLIFASIGYISVNFYCFLPIALFGVYIPDPWLIVMASPNSFFFQVILYTNLAIAIDRFLVFLLPEVHAEMKHSRYLKNDLLIAPWVSAAFIVIHSSCIGYHKRVNPYILAYTYMCSDGGFYGPLLFWFGFCFPTIMFLLYSVVLLKILEHKKRMDKVHSKKFVQKKERREWLFVVQFTIISLLQLFSSLFFAMAPRVLGPTRIASLLMTFFSTLNSMNNPLVMFIFQEQIRRGFFTMARYGFILKVPAEEMTRVQMVTTIERTRTHFAN